MIRLERISAKSGSHFRTVAHSLGKPASAQLTLEPAMCFGVLEGVRQVAIDTTRDALPLAFDQHELHGLLALRADRWR
jgi:hypothetical protein